MKGSDKVITCLQAAAALEANLAEQYLLDARSLKNFGLSGPAGKIRGYAKDCRHYLRHVIKRLQFLEASPAYDAGEVKEAASVTELIDKAATAETAIIKPYEDYIVEATTARDDTTRNMFEHLCKFHEDHLEWLEKQQRLISSLGESGYVSAKI